MVFFPNQVNDDDIELTPSPEGGVASKQVFLTLRQQAKRQKKEPNIALSDFIAPKDSGKTDYMGAFV
jgi:5-methyltetrahydrofolate--homocysteine methyltransferase